MGGSGWGVRVDVNEEFKFFVKNPKQFFFLGGGVRWRGGGWVVEGVRWGGVGLVGRGSGWM